MEDSVRVTAFLILLSFMVMGCSTTSQLASPLDANRKVGASSATLYMRSGARFDAQRISFGQDSTRFVDSAKDSFVQLPTRDIKSVEFTHRIPGSLEGLLFGGLGGLGVGLIAGIGKQSGGDEGMGRGLLILGLGVLGGTGGFLVGAIKGHDYTLIFPGDSVQALATSMDLRNPDP